MTNRLKIFFLYYISHQLFSLSFFPPTASDDWWLWRIIKSSELPVLVLVIIAVAVILIVIIICVLIIFICRKKRAKEKCKYLLCSYFKFILGIISYVSLQCSVLTCNLKNQFINS